MDPWCVFVTQPSHGASDNDCVTTLAAVGRAVGRPRVDATPRLRTVTLATAAPAPQPATAQEATPPPAADRGDGAARIRALFDDALPQLVHQRADLFDRVRGTISVFVEGAGSWCVTFGDHRSPDALGSDASFDSDAVVVFTTPAFVALLDGRPGGEPAVALGDTKLLARLGELLLEPARGALGARLYSATSPKR